MDTENSRKKVYSYEREIKNLESKVEHCPPTDTKPLCREFQKGNCKFGMKCKFQHVLSSNTSKVIQLCQYFVRTGTCKYGEQCRYSHKVTQENRSKLETDTGDSKSFIISRLKELYSSQALLQNGLERLWAEIPLQQKCIPNWHGILKSNDVDSGGLHSLRRFMVGSIYALQTSHGAQDLLSKIETHPQFFNNFVNKVINYPCSTVDLSFQSLLVPFVIMLTHSNIQNSSLPHLANQLYSAVNNQSSRLIKVYVNCLKDYISNYPISWKQSPDNFFLPQTIVQMFLPFVHLLVLLYTKFPPHTIVGKDVSDSFETMFDIIINWRQLLEDKLYATELLGIETDFAIDAVQKKLKELTSIIEFMEQKFVFLKKLEIYTPINYTTKRSALPYEDSEVMQNEYAMFPRHDNDFAEISNIRVMPTMNEILCPHPPFLPGNRLFNRNAHWLEPGPHRLLDTHFRLLREDMTRSVRESINNLVLDLRDGRVPTVQNGSALYHNAAIVELEVEKRNGQLLTTVKFDAPVTHKNISLKEYWTTSKRLEYGVLICLLLQHRQSGDFELFFGTVVNKDPALLAANASIQVSIAGNNCFGISSFITNVHNSKTPHFLLEASRIVINTYSPILEALRAMNPALLPFKEYLCPKELPQNKVDVKPPLYAQATNFRFNLSHLTKGRELFLIPRLDRSKQNCIAELKQFSTLDEGQCNALVAALSSEIICIQGPPGTFF
jgi:hypothetical protein